MSNEPTWKNNIVGHGMAKVSEIIANPNNWKIHTKEQLSVLKGSIEKVGYIRSITINTRTGNLVDGHGRVILAEDDGVHELPAEYVDITPEQERAALMLIDPIAELARPDQQKLDANLRETDTTDPILMQFFSDLASKSGLYQDDAVKSLDQLLAESGDDDPTAFWPTIKIKLSPDDKQRWDAVVAEHADDAQAFVALLGLYEEMALE
jgi:ParB-like chromosome segregation protein Spo0J